MIASSAGRRIRRWHFLTRHRPRFEGNPRMAQMYRVWDKMQDDHKTRVLQDGDAFLAAMESGGEV